MSIHRFLLLTALVLWGASLVLPAVRISSGPSVTGLELLKQGWSGWQNGILAWYANPLILLALGASAVKWDKTAVALSAVGLILALTSYSADETARGAGLSVPGFSFAVGFYVWLGAYAVGLSGSLVGWSRSSTAARRAKMGQHSGIRD